MDILLRTAFVAAMAGCLGLAPGAGRAQDWPAKPVRIVAPYAPGGSADTLGRLVAEHLSETFKQQFFVENKPGAGGIVGSTLVARAAADGYTLVVSGIGSHVVAPAINPNAGYDPLRSFTHIALIGGPPTVFVAHPSLGVATLKEFEELVRRSARRMSYASPGAGTHGHLIGEFFLQKAGLKLEHISYRGAGAAVTDLIAGHVPCGSITLGTAAAHIRSGALKALAVTAAGRLQAFPDVPTFAEQGYPDLVATTWFSLSGPAGLPEDIVKRLNAEVVRILALPQVRARLERDAIATEPLTPADFTGYVAAEIERWTPVVKASGAQPE